MKRYKDEPNTLVITEDNQGKNLKQALIDSIITILSEDNVCQIRYEGAGVYVIEYEHDENIEAWGGVVPMWLTQEEVELILNKRNEEDKVMGSECDLEVEKDETMEE